MLKSDLFEVWILYKYEQTYYMYNEIIHRTWKRKTELQIYLKINTWLYSRIFHPFNVTYNFENETITSNIPSWVSN